MTTSTAIRTYLSDQGMPLTDICVHTGISRRKLTLGHSTAFNATELCTICSYLDIRPEAFFQAGANPNSDLLTVIRHLH